MSINVYMQGCLWKEIRSVKVKTSGKVWIGFLCVFALSWLNECLNDSNPPELIYPDTNDQLHHSVCVCVSVCWQECKTVSDFLPRLSDEFFMTAEADAFGMSRRAVDWVCSQMMLIQKFDRRFVCLSGWWGAMGEAGMMNLMKILELQEAGLYHVDCSSETKMRLNGEWDFSGS